MRRPVVVSSDQHGMRVVADPIRLSRPIETRKALGLGFPDVDDEILAVYDLPPYVKVVIVDPGESAALGIGRLEAGYGLWMVGDRAVTSVRDALERFVDVSVRSDGSGESTRVVYTLSNERTSGTSTYLVAVTEAQRVEIRALLDRLPR